MPTIRRAAALATVAVLPLAALAACGGDDSSASEDSSSTTLSPESVTVPMSQVVTELPKIADQGDEAAAAAADGDFDKATDVYDDMHEAWEEVEGTVKNTDPDAYEAIETAQGLIADGADTKKSDRVQTGADDQREAIDAFVAANS